MATLREFLTDRRSAIQAEIKALRAELREIEAASAALPSADAETTPLPRVSRAGPTLKELAVEILQRHSEGLEANDIRDEMRLRHGLSVKRSSLSPQLSRLAKDRVIRREGHKWLLVPDRVRAWTGWHPDKDEDDENSRTVLQTPPGLEMP